MVLSKRLTLQIAVVFALAPAAVHAQWVSVARKALGKVESMTQKEKTGAPGYSVATVILEGNADKVFATALRTVQSSGKARVTQQDAAKRTLEFAADGQVTGLRVTQVDSKKVQLLFVSSAPPAASDAPPAVVVATLRVCKEMGAVCEVVR